MALSSWPKPTRGRDDDDRHDLVTVAFEDAMLVVVVSEKSIGLTDDEEKYVINIWLPISQISGPTPKLLTWIDTIEIPRWLAEDKNLEYE